eukprot:TRINITY_DN1149_c0_g1_i1.p1 TRINITY_DN1149_c0_g1~~TRINITY_DN1149_c0_g1_i1.p1  ORF type:complete len:1845 (+),score=209.38 TRINITY_DN1149_c0_g1_i1:7722-13256(+)
MQILSPQNWTPTPLKESFFLKVFPFFNQNQKGTDETLLNRVNAMPEDKRKDTHYTKEGMDRRMQEYKDRNTDPQQNLVGFFQKRGVEILTINADLPEAEQQAVLLDFIEKVLGMQKRENRMESQERLQKKKGWRWRKLQRKKTQINQRKKIRKTYQNRKIVMEEHNSDVKSVVESSVLEKVGDKAKDKEKELLESRSQPMRKYLMDKVIPSLAEGILKICKDQPEEPIEFLADFLQKRSLEKAAEERLKAEQKAQQAALDDQKYKTPDKKPRHSEAKQQRTYFSIITFIQHFIAQNAAHSHTLQTIMAQKRIVVVRNITHYKQARMEQYEAKLDRYLARKYPNTDPLSTLAGIADIQAYAAAESSSVYAKPSTLTPATVLTYLFGAKKFDTHFVFWLTCYSEAMPTDPTEVTKLLIAFMDCEEIKIPLVRNRLDLELIDSLSVADKTRALKMTEILLIEIEENLKAVKGNIYKFSKEYVYRWLIHLLRILHEPNIKEESLLAKAGNQSIEIIKTFHISSKYFPEYKENVFVSPLISDITRFLTEVVKGAAEFPDTQKEIISLLWSFCENKDFTLREKVELCHTFYQYFQLIPSITDTTTYWDILSDGLAAEDSIIRKYAITLVKDNLQPFLAQYQQPDKQEISDLWVAFFDIYDTYESYVSHLSKSVWDRVGSIFAYLQKFPSKLQESSKTDALKNMGRWLEALLRRVHTLENSKLKKYVVKYLLKRERYPAPLHQYFFESFLSLLNTPMFYKEAISHMTANSVNSLIPEFIKVLVENSGKSKADAFKAVIRGIQKGVDNQAALLCLFYGLSIIEGEEKFIGEEDLAIIEEILMEKTKEFYISRRYKMAKFLITILSRHLDISQVSLPVLLRVLRFIPTAFYQINVTADLIDPTYKKMLLSLLQGYKTESIMQSIVQSVLGIYSPERLGEKPDKALKELLVQFVPLCRVFALLSNCIDFGKSTSETKKFLEIMQSLFEKLAHFITSAYTNQFSLIASLVAIAKFIRTLLKLGKKDLVQRLLVPCVDTYLASPLSEFLTNILIQFLDPTTIQPGHKDKLVNFVKYRNNIFKLLNDMVVLLHVYPAKPSLRLNKLFSFTISQARIRLENVSSGKYGSSAPLAIILAFVDALIGAYSEVIENKTHPSVIVFEGVFENLGPLLTLVERSKFEEKDFDKSFDPVYKQIIGPGETMKVLGVSQWKIAKELMVIAQIDEKAIQFVKGNAKEIMHNVRKNALPIMVGEMLQVVFDITSLCCEKAYSGVKELSEETAQEFIELIQDCWEAYQQDISNAHRAVVTSLFSLIIHPTMFQFMSVRASEAYKTLLEEILISADKCWLIGRALIGQLVPMLVNHPDCIKGIEDILIKIALSQEHRAEDNAVVLVKAFFNVSAALNKKMVYYDEIDFYGAFIRVAMFELFEKLITQTKHSLLEAGWGSIDPASEDTGVKFGKHITVLESLTKIMLTMLNTFATHTKKEKNAPMNYTAEYRLRLRIGQFVCVLIQVLDKQIANNYFRKTLCETDPVNVVVEGLKSALEPNNAPILRNYLEIATVKLAEEFPNEVLEQIIFPAMRSFKMSVQMRASAVFIGSIIMDRVKDDKLKVEVLKNLIGYVGSHSAFSRTLAQVYIVKYADKLSENDKGLLNPYFNYVKGDKSSSKMAEKVTKLLTEMNQMIDKTSAEMILSSPINDFGEFLSTIYIESVKAAIGSVISLYKEDEGVSGDYLWKEQEKISCNKNSDLKALLAANPNYEASVLEAAEKSKNYQRKILPWEQVEESYEEMKEKQAKRRRNDIILVATLIEKVPNLGGLCRTCEIFNASALVIPSINTMDVLLLNETKIGSAVQEFVREQ